MYSNTVLIARLVQCAFITSLIHLKERPTYCKPLTLHSNVNSHSLRKLCHPGIKSILVWCPTALPVVDYSIQCPSSPVLTNQGTPTVILACVLTTFPVASTQNVASDAVPIGLCTTTVAGGRQGTCHQSSMSSHAVLTCRRRGVPQPCAVPQETTLPQTPGAPIQSQCRLYPLEAPGIVGVHRLVGRSRSVSLGVLVGVGQCRTSVDWQQQTHDVCSLGEQDSL